MIYLTRIFLDYETAALRNVRDVYDWHQCAWDSFPNLKDAKNDKHTEARPFLTRLDNKDGGYQLLILSSTQSYRPKWCPDHEANWHTKIIEDSFLEHQQYRFNLRANPTRKQTTKGLDNKRHNQGKRIAIGSFNDLSKWMERKLSISRCSLKPGSLHISKRGLHHFTIEKENRLGMINIIDFNGILLVNDPAAFRTAFLNGIGSGKAFGCGMLVLQPL